MAHRVDRTVENRARFADWCKHWAKRGDPLPVRLPARYATERIADEQFRVGRTAYELRLARVTVDGDDWYDWEPFLPAERRGKRA